MNTPHCPYMCYGWYPIPGEPGNVMPCEAEPQWFTAGDPPHYYCDEHKHLAHRKVYKWEGE